MTVTGLTGTPKVERRDGVVTIETEGLRVTLRGADAHAEGETVRISLPAPK